MFTAPNTLAVSTLSTNQYLLQYILQQYQLSQSSNVNCAKSNSQPSNIYCTKSYNRVKVPIKTTAVSLTLFPPLRSLWSCWLAGAFMLILHKGRTVILHRREGTMCSFTACTGTTAAAAPCISLHVTILFCHW
jgi:hypothetical protein